MCYKLSVLEDLCLGCKAMCKGKICQSKMSLQFTSKNMLQMLAQHWINLPQREISLTFGTQIVCTWKENGQHFTRSRLVICSPSYSPRCLFWMVPAIRSKTLQGLDKHVLVLTSLLRSAIPQEPGGFTMRAVTGTVREQQEQAGQAQPCPQHSWGGDHSPEMKCSSQPRFCTAPFHMADFHNIFFLPTHYNGNKFLHPFWNWKSLSQSPGKISP